MKRFVMIVTVFLFFTAGIANAADDFNSGSTGTVAFIPPSQVPDGTVAVVNGSITTVTVPLPDNGIFSFTTVSIPPNITVKFKKNVANTPVYILATDDVTINGTIDVSGGSATSSSPIAGVAGPGGFAGGTGGGQYLRGGNGLGPSGGEGGNTSGGSYWDAAGGGGYGSAGQTYYTGTGAGGAIYGNASIVPLLGGSGGGGSGWNNHSYGGGGGGGAILIASSKNIVINGSITASGGNSGDNDRAGGGSGGAIKLMADAISGGGSLLARGGSHGGGVGRIRLEAYTNSFSTSDPQFTFGPPKSAIVINSPSLRITTIGGRPVPQNPTGSYAQPDLLLPSATTNPASVSVTVEASNIPPNTAVKISAIPQFGAASSATAYLEGLDASTTSATADVSISTQYTSVIVVTTTFTIQAIYWNGEKIETAVVSATPGEKSTVTYISKSGKKIKEEQLILAGLVRK